MERSRQLTFKKNSFTLLRIIAALLVLVTHSYNLLGKGDDSLAKFSGNLISFSNLGVDIFFAISGYLICMSLLRSPSIWNYIQNRCLRIFPALIATILVTTFILGPILSTDANYFSTPQTFSYLTNLTIYGFKGFLPGVFETNPITVVNGSLWTLPLELSCYLLLVLVTWCGALNYRTFLTLFFLSFCLHLHDFFPRGQMIYGMELLHLNRLSTIFMGGSLLAILNKRISYSIKYALLAVGVCFVAGRWGQQDWHKFAFFYILLLPYITVSIALNIRKFSWLNEFDFSYGFYLYAFVVQQLLIHYLGKNLSVASLVVLASVITFVIAMLSWIYIEKPALRMKNRSSVIVKNHQILQN